MTTTHQTPVELLRDELLCMETNVSATLSPDGRSVGFIRNAPPGPELWLWAEGRTRRLAEHHGELVGDLRWTADSAALLYRHTQRGRERWSIAGLWVADLSRFSLLGPGVAIEYWLSRTDPRMVVFSSRAPGSRHADLWRIGLTDPGAAIPYARNPGFHRWLVDSELRPRGGTRLGPDGAVRVVVGDDVASARTVFSIPAEAAVDLSIERFSHDGGTLFVLISHGAGTRRLMAVDCHDGTVSTVFEDPDLDIESYPIAGEGVWFEPASGRPDLCTVMDQRLRHHALTDARRTAVEHLAVEGAVARVLIDCSTDDRTWLVVDVRDDGPIAYHLLDPATGTSRELFVNRPGLVGCDLPGLEDFIFAASDGQRIRGYALRPRHADSPSPTVVMVHGGPAGRDIWRFYADAQYLASLGYLSLHINYRGSRGFGSDFRRAGNGEWGGRMQADLYDAVASGVAAGMVDPGRVAFFGASYGGYASLLAACTRPDLVRCAVAISPPCDLVGFATTPPAYWQPLAALLERQIRTTSDGREIDNRTLRKRSPLGALSAACAPVLLAHGMRDPRVPVADVDRFVAEAQAQKVAVQYLRFTDEGHHIKSQANRLILFRAMERFLEGHLGTRQASDNAAVHPQRPGRPVPSVDRPTRP